MIDRLHAFWSNPRYRRLVHNTLSLGVLNATNILLPLLTVPYLIQTLGTETFGLLAFATAFAMYFSVLIDYGFNYASTRDAALILDDKDQLNRLFSIVFYLKLLLLIVSFVIVAIIVTLFDRFTQDASLYFITLATLIGTALFPIWYFQAIEQMKTITYLNLFAKIIFTISIFYVIEQQADYWYVPLLTAVSNLMVAFMALYIIFYTHQLRLIRISWKTLADYLKYGWDYFQINLYANLMSNNNIVLLGLLTNNSVVGIYAIAEKIYSAISAMISPITAATYPFLVKIKQASEAEFFRIFNKLVLALLALSALVMILLLVFMDPILTFVAGQVEAHTKITLTILAFTLLFSNINPTYVNHIVIFNLNNQISSIYRRTFYVNIMITIPLIVLWQAEGLAIAWTITLMTQLMMLYSTTRNIRLQLKPN